MKVRDVFQLSPKMKNLKLLAGSTGLDKTIKDVGVWEVPDGVLWSRRDEFVITTGYFIYKKEIDLMDTLRILKGKGAVGLGIKTDRFIKNIPQKAIDLANELELPLFEIPIYLGYNDFLWPIISNLLSEEDYVNYRFMKFNDQILDVSKKHYRINNIVEVLSEHLEYPFVVLSADKYEIKGQSKEKVKFPIGEVVKIIRENKEKIIEQSKYFYNRTKKNKAWIFPLKTTDEVIGYFCIFPSDDCSTNKIVFKIIKQAIPYLIISMINEVANRDILYSCVEDFLKSTIYRKNISKMKLSEEAKYFNIELNRKRILWILLIRSKKEELDSIKDKIINFLKGELPEAYIFSENYMIVCIEDKEHKAINRKSEFQQLLKKLDYQYPRCEFVIGISKEFENLFHINEAYDEAKFCIQIGERVDDSKIYFFKNLAIYNILYELFDHKFLLKTYRDTILKIKKYDLDSNSELLKTLSKYIDNNFNALKTSQELFIHRNTLYKRLKKIEKIIGMNLNDGDISLILRLCLKLDKIYE